MYKRTPLETPCYPMMLCRSSGMTRNNSHTLGNTRSEATKEWLDRGTTIRRIRGSEALVGPVWASLYYTKGREWKHFPFPKSWCTISSTYASTTVEVRSCSARSLTLLAPTAMLSKAAAAPSPARSCTVAAAAAAVTAAAKRSVVVCVCVCVVVLLTVATSEVLRACLLCSFCSFYIWKYRELVVLL